MARLRAGDDRALAELYDRFAGLVHGVAIRTLRDPSTAADVTQEVFVAVWQRPDVIDTDRGSVAAFLSVLARRRAVDALRRSSRAAQRERRADAIDPGPAEPTVEDAVLTRTTGQRLRAAVGRLPEAQRTAIELAYFDGLTFTEVAARLGIPEGTAKSRLRLALAKLATLLSDERTMAAT